MNDIVYNQMQALFLNEDFVAAFLVEVMPDVIGANVSHVEFEVEGWSVVVGVLGKGLVKVHVASVVGDDYPALLRNLNVLGHSSSSVGKPGSIVFDRRILFYKKYESESIPEASFEKIFEKSNVSCIRLETFGSPFGEG